MGISHFLISTPKGFHYNDLQVIYPRKYPKFFVSWYRLVSLFYGTFLSSLFNWFFIPYYFTMSYNRTDFLAMAKKEFLKRDKVVGGICETDINELADQLCQLNSGELVHLAVDHLSLANNPPICWLTFEWPLTPALLIKFNLYHALKVEMFNRLDEIENKR